MEEEDWREGDKAKTPESQQQKTPSKILSARNCLVCFCIFDDKERRPRGLPCGHTFCSGCISGNISNNILICPNCRAKYEASSTGTFSVNFVLEKLVEETLTGGPVGNCEESEDSMKSLKPISKRLLSQKAEAFAEAEALSNKIANLRSQLEQYVLQLEQWKDVHQHSYSQIGDMMLRINKEEERAKRALEEESRGKTEMEQATESLKSTISRSETLDALEDFHLCFESTEEWLQTTEESFPNRDLVIHSQKMRERCQIGPVNPSPTEVEEPEHHEKCVGGSLAFQDVTPALPDSRLREEGDYSNEKCSTSSMTIQEKINTALHSVCLGYSTKAVQAQCNSESKATQTDCDEFFYLHLMTEGAVDKKKLLAHLLLGRQVFALQEEEESGKKRYARLSLDEKQRMLLHAVSEEPINPETRPTMIKYEEILHHVPSTSRRTFLEFGVDGRSIGRVIISLIDEGKYTENFHILCMGSDQGFTHRHSNNIELVNRGTEDEIFCFGFDCERNDSGGGMDLYSGVDWKKELERDIYKRDLVEPGCVCGFVDNSGSAMSAISTKDNNFTFQFLSFFLPRFGKTEEGLDVIRNAIDRYNDDDMKKLKIIDCGVVLST